MSAAVVGSGLLLGVAVALAVPVQPSLPRREPLRPAPAAAAESDWMRRHRPVLSLLAGVGAATVVGGPLAWPAALAAAVGCWVAIGRSEPAWVRREREAMRRDLPHAVRLLAGALGAGGAPTEALEVVAGALSGPVADRLGAVAARLRLGADPVTVWQVFSAEPALAPLGRTLARAHRSGAPVASSVARLADDLAQAARAEVEDRARRVGVKAAVPLGLCLLPAFVLVGIVPLVGGLATGALG